MFSILRRRPLHFSRLIVRGVCLAASLAACSGMEHESKHRQEAQFAPDWSEHARPLLFHGMGRDPAYTVWQVPNILPRGTYRVIERKHGSAGDTAELVDTGRFEVDSPEKDIYLNISVNYRNPEALEEKYILGLDGAPAK